MNSTSGPPAAPPPPPQALAPRRRSRTRTWALRTLLLLVVLGVLAFAGVYWLVGSIGGRDVLLAQVVARLPAGTTLTWGAAEGPVTGPLTLRDVRFRTPTHAADCDAKAATTATACEVTGYITFFARTIVLDPAIRPLLGRRLRLDALDIAGATLDMPASNEPFTLPTWPEVLPQITPPLSLQADTIRVDGFRVTQAGEPLIDIASVRGGLDASSGALHVSNLRVVSDRGTFAVDGGYRPGQDFRTDITASAVLPAHGGGRAPTIGLVARGDLAQMDIALSGNLPAPLRASLTLHTPATADVDHPRWRVRADSTNFDPALLTGAEPSAVPLAFSLRAQGGGGDATLQGRLERGGQVATIAPSRVQLADQVLTVQPLVLEVLGGSLTLRGKADFSDDTARRFRFAVNARNLTWSGTPAPVTPGTTTLRVPAAPTSPATPDIVANADLGIAGTIEQWAAIGNATLLREGQTAAIKLDSRGTAQGMALKSLQVTMPAGSLQGHGNVAWAPALGWDITATLAGFDPGYFAPDWKGAIDGDIRTQGTTRPPTAAGQPDGGLDVRVAATQLGGQLRGRPLTGNANVLMRGAAPAVDGQPPGVARFEGDVAIGLGRSRIQARGSVDDALSIDASVLPLQLDDLLPGASGTLRGTLQLRGRRDAPDIDVDLTGSALRYQDLRADALTAKGRLPWRGGNGALRITGSGIDRAPPGTAASAMRIDTLALDARGSVEALTLSGDVRGAPGALTLAGNLERRGTAWQGGLRTLVLDPVQGATWTLQAPANFRIDGPRMTLSRSCFGAAGGGSLCATVDWPRTADVTGTQLPLTLLSPYLPALSPDAEGNAPAWALRGAIDITARVNGGKRAGQFNGTARVTSATGGLRLGESRRRELVGYDDLALDLRFDQATFDATLATRLTGGTCRGGSCANGRIDARISSGWADYAPLSGRVALDTSELTWMELLSPDIVEPTGKLDGVITLGGTRAAPTLGGQAQLTGFAAEIPSLAIALVNGNVRLDAQPDGAARISGSLGTQSAAGTGAGGTLAIDGTLGWRQGPGADGTMAPLQLNVRGKGVLIADTRDLRTVVDPDLQVRYAAGQPLRVTGSVGVPSARLDLERLSSGVSISPDVVVLDPYDAKRAVATPLSLDLDINVVLGDDVTLRGFGLDGTLGGSLRVTQAPGRDMRALGLLEVGGKYKAYGQELEIVRGRLLWNNGIIGDPLLDIRAQRVVDEVTAGVDVGGRATAPTATVWTDPASSQTEALSYLAFGRSLTGLSAAEGRQLDASAAALSAGGSLLASQLGARLGLDDASFSESRALGGSTLGIGKYLSPRLYVGFGVSLLGTGQVITLRYMLRRGFGVELESSTVENRGSINWRKER